jgi:FlaA1/EpsC-like NDP-sugar epimerase
VKPDATSPAVNLLQRVPVVRMLALFAFHAVVFASCYLLAWQLRFEFAVPSYAVRQMLNSLPYVVLVQLAFGAAFDFYRGWWSYVGIRDALNLVTSLTIALILMLVVWHAALPLGLPVRYMKPPRGVLTIDWAFSILALFGARVLVRVTRDRFRGALTAAGRNVLIVGAGDAGEGLAREIEHRPQLGMTVVGFIDDQRAKWGSRIRGIRVHGPISEAGRIARALEAEEALIAIPSASGRRIREIIHDLSEAGLRFKTMPGIDQLVSGRVNLSQLRPVNVEDLMRRARIELPGDPVRKLFRGRRVLLTGAGGTIGAELAVQITQFEPEALVLVERSEFALYEVGRRLAREAAGTTARISYVLLDAADRGVIDPLLARERPEIVLHAAAHKHVPLGEENAREYLENNCLATRDLAELCEQRGVERFVFVSTDKAINPTSVMGATKRAAEIALLDLARTSRMKVTAVRFGNVIGSSGSVIPLFMEQIAAGGPVTVTHPEVTRYFLRTSEAVSLVLQAATLAHHGCIYMLDMGEPVKIADLARDLIRLSNHSEHDIQIRFVGLRPGEKLFEEIRLEGESVRPTDHPQIVVTEAPQPDPADVKRWLELVHDERARDGAAVIAALRALVPEYAPEAQGAGAPALVTS